MKNIIAKPVTGYHSLDNSVHAKTLEEYILIGYKETLWETGEIPSIDQVVYGLIEFDDLFADKFGYALPADEQELKQELTEFVWETLCKVFK